MKNMDGNDFNALLNSCQNPRDTYNALQALALTTEEGNLLDMIRNSKDPSKALEVAIGVIKEALVA